MQDIRMRFEMPVSGQMPNHHHHQQPSVQTTVFGSNNNQSPSAQQRPMNLYTKTNHGGVILSTSNLLANTMNNNSPGIEMHQNNHNNSPGKLRDVPMPNKSPAITSAPAHCGDMNSNLIKLKAIANTFVPNSNSPTSSEEDNSPTEMNNCRRMLDKPPLVKRLTMGLLMKTTEDSRPLVYNTHNHSPGLPQLNNNNNNNASYNNNSSPNSANGRKGAQNCDGYVNEAICDRDRIVKFDDASRQSLMVIHQMDNNQNHEFNFKKNLLRETSSANSSPKLFPNTFKARDHLTPQEQQELKGAAWFQAGIPREISLEVLSKQNPGAFIVRQSTSKPGCFALSLRVPPPSPKVAHYLILRTARGYKIKGFTKEFTSLRALITHHSVMPELLPVPLSLPRPQVVPHPRELDDLDSYSSLTDFRKMMSDLNV